MGYPRIPVGTSVCCHYGSYIMLKACLPSDKLAWLVLRSSIDLLKHANADTSSRSPTELVNSDEVRITQVVAESPGEVLNSSVWIQNLTALSNSWKIMYYLSDEKQTKREVLECPHFTIIKWSSFNS